MTLRASLALASTLTALGVLALTATPALAAPQTLKVSVTGFGQLNDSLGLIVGCEEAGGTCEAAYEEGTSLTLFAGRDTHSRFAGWEGCPNVLSAGEYATGECEVTLSAATEVKAKFTAIPQAELEVTVEGAGEVTSSPAGIACASGTCKEHFDSEGPESAVTLTAAASPDNHFEEWLGVPCDKSTATTCEVTMSAARSVKAVFAPTFQTLRLAPTGPGSLAAASGAITACEETVGICSGPYQEGSTVVLAAVPAAHHHVTWSGCTPKPTEEDECEVTIGSAETVVEASFPINEHTLTVSRTGLGSVSANQGAISACSPTGGTCSGVYDEASTILLTAIPAAHREVAWTGCKAVPSPDTCEVEIGPADETLHAAFPGIPQTLTVTPTGQGSVRATSGAIRNCTTTSGTCSGPYIETATAVLIATPAPGRVVAWEGCTAVPSPDFCEVQIGPSEATVQAGFAPITHALTVHKAGTGTGQLTCNGAPCAARYPEGTALTIAASPAAGSTFAGWSGAGCTGAGTCKVTLETDTTLTATFNANPPPAEERCLVPQLAGKTLAQARSALTAVHCSLGKVTKPKKKGPLVVKSSSPAAGTSLPAASAVSLKLSLKPKKKKH